MFYLCVCLSAHPSPHSKLPMSSVRVNMVSCPMIQQTPPPTCCFLRSTTSRHSALQRSVPNCLPLWRNVGPTSVPYRRVPTSCGNPLDFVWPLFSGLTSWYLMKSKHMLLSDMFPLSLMFPQLNCRFFNYRDHKWFFFAFLKIQYSNKAHNRYSVNTNQLHLKTPYSWVSNVNWRSSLQCAPWPRMTSCFCFFSYL